MVSIYAGRGVGGLEIDDLRVRDGSIQGLSLISAFSESSSHVVLAVSVTKIISCIFYDLLATDHGPRF